MGWDENNYETMEFGDDDSITYGGYSNDDQAAMSKAWGEGLGWSPSKDYQGDFQFDNQMSNDWNTIDYNDNGTQMYSWDNDLAGGNYTPSLVDNSNLYAPMSPPSSVSDFFSKLGTGIGNNPDKVLGGLYSVYQNRKKSQMLQDALNRPAFDPFGSQRPQYQQELSRAVSDPYSSPIVANQVRAIQEAQDRRDAAAGRRSNKVGSAPAVLAAQGKVAQDYINSMMTPAGANIAPSASALGDLYKQQIGAETSGLAPLFQAYGAIKQGERGADDQAAFIAKLKEALGR